METGPARLRAGYKHARGRGVAAYAGVLRQGEGREPDWQCPHIHISPPVAVHCAEAELERRRQGAREVLSLLHCGSCGIWYDVSRAGDLEVLGDGRCPQCYVPVVREKVIILEREEAKVR